MSRDDKLIQKLKDDKSTVTFDDAVSILGSVGFVLKNKGKTSGSRVMFVNNERSLKLIMHKPHPRKELLSYQKKQLRDFLEQEGLI